MTEPIYRIEDLAKIYHGRQVLNISALEIQAGEVLALVGPSGAGKSTLLRLLNFLESPSHGKIVFRGIEFSAGMEMPLPLRRQVTTVFQQPVLLEGSVQENVTYGLRLRGQHNHASLCYEMLRRVGMEKFTRQRSRSLSGGEAQRVALARALAITPNVLLLDEPTANLDPYNVSLIETIIKEMTQEHGTTIILVTHNVFQARRMAQRVGLLLEGKLIETAPVEMFFSQPVDPRTSAFIRGELVY
jgi:tungstate transport system ATP-binding protein